jgi:thiol-disulfide isomerase/thioredoxin
MKRVLKYLIVLLALMSGSVALDAQQLDSARTAALEERLVEYFDLLKFESIDVQKAEADLMIEAAADPAVRQAVALRIYDHYLGSPVMGAEAVAIHIYDKWFEPGKVSIGSDMDLMSARIFAEFNRQSLIGEKSPELVMETLQGDTLRLFTDRKIHAGKGDRHKVLFFYDHGCSKCKLETILLGNLLQAEDYPIDFYAIYTGDNRQAWESYVTDRFDVNPLNSRVYHLWDPTLDSDFQRKYGVVQTPRLFLVRPDGVIKGRGLNARALSLMLDEIFASPDLDYGKPESEAYFDQLMTLFRPGEGDAPSAAVQQAADHMAVSALQAGDTTMFRQFLGDFLYYLAPKSGEDVKEGMKYLIDNYIEGRSDIWKSQDDSLKIIGFAQIMDDLLSKAVPGSPIPDLKLPGDFLRHGKRIKTGQFALSKLRGQKNIIIFYTEGCNICDAEKAAARRLVSEDSRYRVLMVNVDRIVSSDPALASRLFDKFDLSSLPFIIETDKTGIILRRYITLQ